MSQKVVVSRPEDLPPVPCSMGGMDWNPTGLWRYLTPVPRDKAAPCRAACPAGNPIPQLMQLWAEGKGDAALNLIMETNPLPGVTGRLCFHPCQPACLRRKVDRGLPIQGLECWAASQGKALKRAPKRKGPRVAVIGAGPVGLTCAYLLGRQGFKVTLYDPGAKAGGFLVGAKGLSAPVLRAEIERLAGLSGIAFKLGGDFGSRAVCGGKSAPVLVVIDDFAHTAGSAENKALAAAWPLGEAAPGDTPVLHPAVKQGFKGFKPSQVAQAVGLGQKLAAEALAALGGQEYREKTAPAPVDPASVKPGRFVAEKPLRQPPARLDAKRAQYEAGRCMSCGTCNLCQECVLYCPDACLRADGAAGKIKVDLEHCKGCGICAEECPRGVISMEAAQ